LEVTGRTVSSIKLAWSASQTSPVFYKLFRGGQDIHDGPELSFVDTNLQPETAYTYSVEAVDGNGQASAMLTMSTTTLELTRGFLNQAYRDVTGRPVDQSGYGYWKAQLDSGRTTRATIAHGLAYSQESYSNVLVPDMYQRFLGRNPDPGGLNWTIGRLQGGATYEQMAAGLIASDEYFARSGGKNQSFVSRLYTNVLGRVSDPGGLAAWTSNLDRGMSRYDVGYAFLTSTEGLNNRVSALYWQFLHRGPDSGGVAYDVPRLQNGTVRDQDVIASLVSSREYMDRVITAFPNCGSYC
jgi:hypothetical protein